MCKVFGMKYIYMDVSENSGSPKSSILIGFSIINHPFWGTTIFGNTYIPGTLNNHLKKWMFGDFPTMFLCNDLLHHPIETTISKWMFQVPGIYL